MLGWLAFCAVCGPTFVQCLLTLTLTLSCFSDSASSLVVIRGHFHMICIWNAPCRNHPSMCRPHLRRNSCLHPSCAPTPGTYGPRGTNSCTLRHLGRRARHLLARIPRIACSAPQLPRIAGSCAQMITQRSAWTPKPWK